MTTRVSDLRVRESVTCDRNVQSVVVMKKAGDQPRERKNERRGKHHLALHKTENARPSLTKGGPDKPHVMHNARRFKRPSSAVTLHRSPVPSYPRYQEGNRVGRNPVKVERATRCHRVPKQVATCERLCVRPGYLSAGMTSVAGFPSRYPCYPFGTTVVGF